VTDRGLLDAMKVTAGDGERTLIGVAGGGSVGRSGRFGQVCEGQVTMTPGSGLLASEKTATPLSLSPG